MGTLSRDTTKQAELAQIEIIRKMPAWKKFQLLEDANRTANELAIVGLRSRNPEATPVQIRRMLMDLLLGHVLAECVYGSRRDV